MVGAGFVIKLGDLSPGCGLAGKQRPFHELTDGQSRLGSLDQTDSSYQSVAVLVDVVSYS